MKTKVIFGVMVVLILIVAIFTLSKTNFSELRQTTDLKIGALYAISGPGAVYGEISLRGVKDAISYFEENRNAKINLILEDTAGDPAKAVSAGNKMFNIDGVKFAVTGTSAVTSAIGPLADQYGALVITDAAGYGLTKDRKYLLQNLMPSLNDVALRINQSEDWNRVAIVYINDEFGSKWANQTVQNLSQDKISQTFSFERNSTDFRTQSAKIKEFSPDIIVVIGYGPALNQAHADMQIIGLSATVGSVVNVSATNGTALSAPATNTSVPKLTYLSCTLPGVLSDSRFNLDGQFSYEYPEIVTGKISDWMSKNNYENKESTFYRLAFENTLAILEAQYKFGDNVSDAIDFLKTEGVSGLYGEIKFDESGVVYRDLVLKEVSGGECVDVSVE